jgi:hypothetical protein
MRVTMLIGLALLIILSGTPVPALAQASDETSIDLQLEMKRKRSVVPPPAETSPAVSDAEAAARRLEEQRRAEELSNKAMQPPPPPLDPSVVEGSRSRQRQEQSKP